ncbi:hypothetical protein Sjap_018604 [Stephania japonica]|uniref:Uncharacterized protein n=1 Tax=Stephania japonica TaxID=461633 RepID=A0AAP0NLA9_9MAGN
MADRSRPLEILSDDGDDPSSPPFKKPFRPFDRPESTAVVILDDDPTPKKATPSTSTPSIVPETPMSPTPRRGFDSDVSIVKCTARISASDPNCSGSGIGGLIFLESDNESEGGHEENGSKENEKLGTDLEGSSRMNSSFREYPSFRESEIDTYTDDLTYSVGDRFKHRECSVDVTCEFEWEANAELEQVANVREFKEKGSEVDAGKKNRKDEAMARKRKTKEEKIQLAEERKLKREVSFLSLVLCLEPECIQQEKLQKQAMKAEALEMKKLQKEQQKWEKGKFALKSIVAEIDAKVVELGSIGGHLLSRFAEKGLNFRITSNPIERSIIWKMTVPEQLSKVLAKLSTDFVKVHTRQCRDEAEVADHVAGLTYSLASCQYRLKVLVAIPKVQPRFAVAIWKKYPTMKSLLSVYMDPNKSVHEKEFLLTDLPTEGLLGQEDRRVGEICSKRVYRIIMAQNGNIITDDVEDGADFFSC